VINPFIHFPFKAPRTAFAFTLPPANAMTGFFDRQDNVDQALQASQTAVERAVRQGGYLK
jgi:hypothetical protein